MRPRPSVDFGGSEPLTVLLGNAGSPRWYAGPERSFSTYLDMLEKVGATSTEIVLHHGPYDERTARVHVIDPDWESTVEAYHRRGMAIQLHVSLDQRFATSRWRVDREGLKSEYEPIISLALSAVERQERLSLVIHGASDPNVTLPQNEDATLGLIDWLADRFEDERASISVALELGAAKPGRETAAARSRDSVLRIVRRAASSAAGICWDVAHDIENSSDELDWSIDPGRDFLARVRHVHLHDVDDQGMAHYPLLLGTVPYKAQLDALLRSQPLPSMTMEVRWICASRLGEPWEVLIQSYRAVQSKLALLPANG